jgi:hypothetical protein
MNPHPPDGLDYYGILGVAPDASPAEIKRAYRALVKRYHPDLYALNPEVVWEAEIVMSEINGAYDVLSDSQKRRRYDQQLQEQAAAWTTTSDSAAGQKARAESDHRDDWTGLLFATSSGQNWLTTLLQWLSAQRSTSGHKQLMGSLSKMLLAPIPFCIAVIVSALFWRLGTVTGAGLLGGLSAVLAYPLILLPLLLRLWFPIRYRPLLSFRQKLAWTPIIVVSAMLLGWLWFVLVDQHGRANSPLDLYWWCGLIIVTCVSLAYL